MANRPALWSHDLLLEDRARQGWQILLHAATRPPAAANGAAASACKRPEHRAVGGQQLGPRDAACPRRRDARKVVVEERGPHARRRCSLKGVCVHVEQRERRRRRVARGFAGGAVTAEQDLVEEMQQPRVVLVGAESCLRARKV